jgi:AcrR family transcriptional regulator
MRPSPKAQTRERILDAALALLHEVGYDKLTQPQVAKAAGITQGHLTYYFPTRSDLLLAVVEHSVRAAIAPLLQSQATNVPPQAASRLIRRALLEKQRTRMMLALIIASDAQRDLKKPLRQVVQHARQFVETVLHRLGTPPDAETAALLHACIVGLAVVTFAIDSPKGDREMGKAAEKLLAMFAADPSARSRRGKRATQDYQGTSD